jgi:hypothetical protein
MIRTSMCLLVVLLLAACGEKPQTATARKADDKPWDSAATKFDAAGFKPGDKAAWEQQLKSRNQGQNEYSRTSAQ